MYMGQSFSYWEQKSFLSDCDVIIVGSGIVGLNAALRLKKNKLSLNVGVLEAGFLPSGASTKMRVLPALEAFLKRWMRL
jgi:gamma-glutamylputrescine oxidase